MNVRVARADLAALETLLRKALKSIQMRQPCLPCPCNGSCLSALVVAGCSPRELRAAGAAGTVPGDSAMKRSVKGDMVQIHWERECQVDWNMCTVHFFGNAMSYHPDLSAASSSLILLNTIPVFAHGVCQMCCLTVQLPPKERQAQCFGSMYSSPGLLMANHPRHLTKSAASVQLRVMVSRVHSHMRWVANPSGSL